jgi:hypothetical protein
MRASAAEYRSLPLRGHELLRDVPLYDVSSVDLPGGGSGRTVADIRALESATAPSHVATFIYGLRHFLGRVFGWDREPMRPEDSFLERLSERDRRDSEITPGTLEGHFWVLYQFPGEALRETRAQQDCPRLHLHCLGEQPERVPFVLRSLRPPRVVAHATVPRRDRTISSRSVSSHASPHSSRVACCLRWHEPNRYHLMGD